MEQLEIRNLSLQIGEVPVLRDFSCKIDMGESLTIIGESGSGKTLLAKLLVGHIPQGMTVRGNIFFKGVDLGKLTVKQWQKLRGRDIAYLVQNPMSMFNPFQKIEAHILETILSHEKCSKRVALSKALEWMKRLNLDDAISLLKKYPFELSGGMLQRIMLATILSLDPQVIILDEPTSAVDCHNCSTISAILQELQNNGKTLITVTHDYQLARDLGGQLLVISEGEVVEQGQTQAILSNPQHNYTKALTVQMEYEGDILNVGL